MSNLAARFNMNHAKSVGPRQCLIISVLATSKPLTVSEVVAKFKLPKSAACTMRATLKSLIGKGLVVLDTSTAKPTTDGFLIGERFAVTAAGRALAKRMRRIENLGNSFGVVRGHH